MYGYYEVRLEVTDPNPEQLEVLKRCSLRGVMSLNPMETHEAIGYFEASTRNLTHEEKTFFDLLRECKASSEEVV